MVGIACRDNNVCPFCDQVPTNLDPESVAMEAMKRATICCRVPNSQAANAAQHFKPPRITVLDESKAYDDLEFQSGPFTVVDAEGSYNWADCIGGTDFRAALCRVSST